MSQQELQEVKGIIGRMVARGDIHIKRSEPTTDTTPKRDGLAMTKGAIYQRKRRAAWLKKGLTVEGKKRQRPWTRSGE